jgi:hypothetical protein
VLEGEHVRDAKHPVPDARQPLLLDVVEVVDADWDAPQDDRRQAGVVDGPQLHIDHNPADDEREHSHKEDIALVTADLLVAFTGDVL